MSRLIDADALIEDVRKNSVSYFADDFAHEWVDKQPTIEPEQPQIIHCKDCKHWMRAYLDISGKFGCNVMRDYTAPNDYCFKAERKEDAKNSVDM